MIFENALSHSGIKFMYKKKANGGVSFLEIAVILVVFFCK